MEIKDPDKGINGYVYSHETRCQGQIVLVLPYRTVGKDTEYLVKSEVTPCWSMEPVKSGVTGGYEGGAISEDAIREMLEETGYTITRADLEYLGTCYASKSADTVYTLYGVDLTGFEQGEALGDGSRVEAEAEAIWLPFEDVVYLQDAQLCTALLRLTA